MTLIQLERALRLGFGFLGAANVQDLRKRAEFIVASRVNGASQCGDDMVTTENNRQL